jgi:hypothetical protein
MKNTAPTKLHDTTMDKETPDWLDLALKDPLQGYCDHFGGYFPRPDLIKYAGAYGGLEAIKQLLTEHVLADRRVEDWEAFARELLRRKGQA